MPSPYIYPAANFQPTSYLKYSPYQPATPFIPSAFTFPVPTALPYARSITPIDDSPYYASNYPYRSRAFLWSAGVPQNAFSQSSWLPHYRRRTRSAAGISSLWDDSPYSPWDYHGTAHHALLHPLLNGDSTLNDLYFDLSSPSFSPMRALSTEQFVPISSGELSQAATTPPVTRMRVVHHSIPQWPIDVELRYNEYAPGTTLPITVGDVLYMIHRSLRRQISHADWAMLSHWKRTEVARAYTRRYSSVPQMGQLEASKGVRRVDYLGASEG
ncbi:hypothetical protein PISMIDRAFT_690770 [Pisolithus microcarpus 441]|uniref:DUF6699 domain-containing protein n=1 Tax=Pisolithus microcarpus 441 TaxID=765257 RepID=A0A0C9Y0J3_9AGAM|nr:hypothetical protein PISMIDRAFT_690776 [Pisolithus microcarpus 441]KIK10739.1 hypothetical protein PISMIDRAFT_690770 [Pisolithus microcarpus 441]